MSIFNGQRLTNDVLQLDFEGIRRGIYTDRYFENVRFLLSELSQKGYTYRNQAIGDIEVEAQWFTRRAPMAIVGGVDAVLEIFRHCVGYFDEEKNFVNKRDALEIEAVQDGVCVFYHGDPADVAPVIRVRGMYRYFGQLETVTLGLLSRISRMATNTYELLKASKGKPVLFFPARYDLYQTQAADGYGYHLGVQRYNMDHRASAPTFISTDAQGAWWGGKGGGTIPHALIASFLGDTVEAMLQFAAILPPATPRIALVDFENDVVSTSLAVTKAMFERYLALKQANDDSAERFKLNGVRVDTATNLRDKSVEPLGDPNLDLGVNPRMITTLRRALNNAWQSWDIPTAWQAEAEAYCQQIRIVATGGFSVEKIALFERLGVPVDVYGVGSSFLLNDSAHNTDFTTDLVRVKCDGQWIDIAKVGRRPNDNPDLALVR